MLLITLAAGKGTRLGPLGKLIPKLLIPLGAHRRIADTHQNLAKALQISNWYVVAGKQINQLHRTLTSDAALRITLLYNSLHTSPSPLYSLARVIPALVWHDAVIVNSDTLYHAKLARSISRHKTGIFLYLSRTKATAADMKLIIHQGRVVQAITPSKTGANVSSGLVVVKGWRYRWLFICAILGAVLRFWLGKPGYWHQVFNGILSWSGVVQAVVVPKNTWIEIDTLADRNQAKKHAAGFF